jgi:hypothetical protein
MAKSICTNYVRPSKSIYKGTNPIKIAVVQETRLCQAKNDTVKRLLTSEKDIYMREWEREEDDARDVALMLRARKA